MAYNPFDTETNDESVEHVEDPIDDLELPEGEELDFGKMINTIKKVDEGIMPKEQEHGNEEVGPTPTTPRPNLPPSKDSKAQLVPNSFSLDGRGSSPRGQETDDDPDDDVLSMNTDINRHERSLSTITAQISDIAQKVNMLPDLDSRMRSLVKSNAEMETRCKTLSQEIENLRKSMNMYQSSTANKIADVERRAAEKQLSTTAVPDTTLVPPAEIHSVRDPDVTVNRPGETIPAIAVASAPVKKRAVISDW